MNTPPTVAVLALQGDYAKHIDTLRGLGVNTVAARLPRDLDDADALVLPGGESTTMGKLMARYGLDAAIRQMADAKKPIYGTCAGLILLSRDIEAGTGEKGGQPTLGLLDIAVARNAFGRQLDSFEATIDVPAVGSEPVRAVFIRAPYVTHVGPNVDVLASYDGKIVCVRQGSILGTAFHPELSGDTRLHALFLSLIPT